MKKYLKFIYFFSIPIICFFFVNIAKADYVVIDASTPNTNYYSTMRGQNFRVATSTNNISAVGLYLTLKTTGYFEMIICKSIGNFQQTNFNFDGVWPYYRVHCYPGDTLIGSSSAIYGTNADTPLETKVTFVTPQSVVANQWYYFIVIPQPQAAPTINRAIWGDNDILPVMHEIGGASNDLNFKLYSGEPLDADTSIILDRPINGSTKTPCNFNIWQAIYQFSSSTLSTYNGYDAYVDINYYNITTKKEYLSTDTGLAKFIGEINNENFLWGVPYFEVWTNPLEMPKTLGYYMATTTLWAHDPIYGTNYQLAATTSQFRLATSSDCAVDILLPTGWCSNICSDIATSTFINDIVCAGRLTLCYMFVPHSFTYQYFSDSITLYKNAFPFNTIFQLSNTITNTIASTTITTTDTIGIPFVRNQSGHANYYVLPVLASSSLPNAVSGTNANLVRNTLSYLIWMITISLIIIIIWFFH